MTKKTKQHNNKTRKNRKVNGRILCKKEGWIHIHIYGAPYERGYAHGYLLHKELKRSRKVLEFTVKNDFETSLTQYIETCRRMLYHIIKNNHFEIYEELRGIVEGAKAKGLHISIEFLIASNALLSMYQHYHGKTG